MSESLCESPILHRTSKNDLPLQTCNNYWEILNKLKAHLNKSCLLSKHELNYLNKKFHKNLSTDTNNRWIILKIKRLLASAIKTEQKSGLLGFSKNSNDSYSDSNSSFNFFNGMDLKPYKSPEEMKLSLLTNNNFVTLENNETLSNLEQSKNFDYLSPDLFNTCIETSLTVEKTIDFKTPLNDFEEISSLDSTITVKKRISDDFFDLDYDKIGEEIDNANKNLEEALNKIFVGLSDIAKTEHCENIQRDEKSVLKRQCSEENFKIIREACLKYKENLRRNPSFQVIDEKTAFKRFG